MISTEPEFLNFSGFGFGILIGIGGFPSKKDRIPRRVFQTQNNFQTKIPCYFQLHVTNFQLFSGGGKLKEFLVPILVKGVIQKTDQ